MDMSVGEIAQRIGGSVIGDADVRIIGLNTLKEAGKGELAFLTGAKYLPLMATTHAAAVIAPLDFAQWDRPIIQTAQPYAAFGHLLGLLESEQRPRLAGVHPEAVIGENVQLGQGVAVDAHARICDGAIIGDGCQIYAGAYIGSHSRLGPNCVLHPNVVIREYITIGARCIIHSGAVIGADGFGFMMVDGVHRKIPQVGTVVVGDDVEIGANSAVDRATCGSTVIGEGTKIDNLVQVAHNVKIGKHCVISGKTGIAGSAVIGDYVTLAAQVGVAGHLEIGERAVVAARSGVTKSIPAGKVVSGFPATDHEREKRRLAGTRRVPDLVAEIRELKNRIAELEERLNG